jgi:hypothetical protein
MNRKLVVVVCDVLFFLLLVTPVSTKIAAAADCTKNIDDPQTNAWASKLIAAIADDDSCSAIAGDTGDSFAATSACNIFVGRVMLKVYGLSDFVVSPPDPQKTFYQANEIATFLQAGVWKGWTEVGLANDQTVLNQAQQDAGAGEIVLAIRRDDDTGHVALIGPGPLTPGWGGLQTPVSASFFLNKPQKAFLGIPLSCAFRDEQKGEVHIWAH